MKNWLNQEINEGDLVYYGARSGNTSTYRLGKVIGFPERKPESKWDEDSPLGPQKVRVAWIAEPGVMWEKFPHPRLHGRTQNVKMDIVKRSTKSDSTLELNALIRVDVDVDSLKFM